MTDKAGRVGRSLLYSKFICIACAAISFAAGAPARGQSAAAKQLRNVCATDGDLRGRVVDVDARLELTLDTGVRLRLSGIEPPRSTLDNPGLALEARDRLKSWLVGREIHFQHLSSAPDRWGRMEANVSAPEPDGGSSLSVAEALLDAGLARALPDAVSRACMPGLLRHEQAARAARRGLWTDRSYAILAAQDRDAFANRGGETIVVEGDVLGSGETRAITYLNFGPIRTVDFAVTLRRQALRLFETAGLHPRDFEGQRLRVRGQLDTRFGPQIDIADPAAIEILSDERKPPQSRPVTGR